MGLVIFCSCLRRRTINPHMHGVKTCLSSIIRAPLRLPLPYRLRNPASRVLPLSTALQNRRSAPTASS